MKKITLTLLAALIMLVLTACGSNEAEKDNTSANKLEKLQKTGKVKIGFANEAPYAYEEKGKLKGANVDIAKAVFKELGVDKVEAQLSDFDQLIPGVQAGQFDVITAGMAINPDRCESVLFSEPEMKYGEGLIVAAGNPHNLQSYRDIAENPKLKVVVMQGTTEIEFLKKEGVRDNQIVTAPDIPATFSAIQSGRADATTGTEMTVKMALQSANTDKLEFVETFKQPDVEGVPSYGAAAFNLKDKELRDAYNEKLKELKDNGTIAKILEENGFSEISNMVKVGTITTKQVCDGNK
ncbi:ectoine/hydroxyectoine ABC transporter substrate-binding protein EhuB [Rummeliibacillus suwonensis]|jgi:polar amino acid transport system substrate-binding protein|uniref:ectoine/hydroxyectoine ABC transporter substrate-binding protein EhuB n=1 Tax=Rummeliibacillus suwonensis TaxID=1306154 RepID=UPI0011B46AEF|nr:ectoine/hydroxyectoine ABC transporter substrate-binding protein EhuB [Rummeliibacillus suwonensis]MBO2536854.1 ectoine/hydroxyectoine ABC transporter substrate-binding protein EhuB [Rummeliibacillus suwonensis]